MNIVLTFCNMMIFIVIPVTIAAILVRRKNAGK